MDESAKQAVDTLAATVTVTSLMGWLPPLSAFLTCVWLCLRIYESETVQGWVNRDRDK